MESQTVCKLGLTFHIISAAVHGRMQGFSLAGVLVDLQAPAGSMARGQVGCEGQAGEFTKMLSLRLKKLLSERNVVYCTSLAKQHIMCSISAPSLEALWEVPVAFAPLGSARALERLRNILV